MNAATGMYLAVSRYSAAKLLRACSDAFILSFILVLLFVCLLFLLWVLVAVVYFVVCGWCENRLGWCKCRHKSLHRNLHRNTQERARAWTSYRLKYCVCLKHCDVIFLCDSLCSIKITYSILVQIMVRDNPTHTSAFTHKQRAIKIITAQNDTAAAMENEMASETAAFRSVGAQFVRFAR